MKNCLACFQPLGKDEVNYYSGCLAAFWQQDTPVLQLDFSLPELEKLAKENIAHRIIFHSPISV